MALYQTLLCRSNSRGTGLGAAHKLRPGVASNLHPRTQGTPMEKGDRLCKKIFWAFLAVLCPVVSAFGPSQQVTSQSSEQSSSLTQSQTQPGPEKRETLGDAANRSGKDKAKPKKVYTEQDLSGMRGNGVSVAGSEKPAESGAAGTKKPDGRPKAGVVPMSGLPILRTAMAR